MGCLYLFCAARLDVRRGELLPSLGELRQGQAGFFISGKTTKALGRHRFLVGEARSSKGTQRATTMLLDTKRILLDPDRIEAT